MCKTFSNIFHTKQKLPARDMTRPSVQNKFAGPTKHENLSWKFQSWSCSNPTWFVHLRYCYDMELWTRRILLPVFHRPPLEVHALLVDRLQPQILIIEFAKTALPGAAPSPIYGFKPHVSSQNVGQIPNYVLLVIQSSPSLLHLLFIVLIIPNHPESFLGMDI